MNKLLVISLVAITGYSGYEFYNYFNKEADASIESVQRRAEGARTVAGVTNIDTYPAHVQAAYNAIPFKLWRLRGTSFSSEELEAEVKRIRTVIGSGVPHVSNKFVWVVGNLPIKADLKKTPIVYEFDKGKFARYSAAYSLSNIMTQDDLAKLLNSPIADVVEITREIVVKADTIYKEDVVKRAIVDLAITMKNMLRMPDADKAADLEKLKTSVSYQTIIKLKPEFNIEDFSNNIPAAFKDLDIDINNYPFLLEKDPTLLQPEGAVDGVVGQ